MAKAKPTSLHCWVLNTGILCSNRYTHNWKERKYVLKNELTQDKKVSIISSDSKKNDQSPSGWADLSVLGTNTELQVLQKTPTTPDHVHEVHLHVGLPSRGLWSRKGLEAHPVPRTAKATHAAPHTHPLRPSASARWKRKGEEKRKKQRTRGRKPPPPPLTAERKRERAPSPPSAHKQNGARDRARRNRFLLSSLSLSLSRLLRTVTSDARHKGRT
ncbi:uncharacterized protein [Heliangelus exortis]|uniref:uncharacterized protein n=1 Tax=Heliangelus exortis TaxID=472823 RepID=UPI003A93E13A